MSRRTYRYNHDEDPEVLRLRQELHRARFPRYEDLDIEEVVFDSNEDFTPDKSLDRSLD